MHCCASSIPQPIPLSNTSDTAGYFSFLQFFISAEATLIGRVSGAWCLASLGVTVTAICIPFSIVVVYRIPCLRAFCTAVILIALEYWSLRMRRTILDRGLHAGRVVLCTPIFGACIRICQICLLFSEVEMRSFVLRLWSLPGATFPSLGFQGLVHRCLFTSPLTRSQSTELVR